MAYLQLPPCPAVDKPQDLLAWAVRHWDIARIPPQPICTEDAPAETI